MNYYVTPSEVSGVAPGRKFRLGGMVEEGSIKHARAGSLSTQFQLTDFTDSVLVRYSGLLPELFREGEGCVCEGAMGDGVFLASEVLAKHDEALMPNQVTEQIYKAMQEKRERAAELAVLQGEIQTIEGVRGNESVLESGGGGGALAENSNWGTWGNK